MKDQPVPPLGASRQPVSSSPRTIAASLALQFGCPLETLQRALLRDAHGNASTPLGASLDLTAENEGTRR